jgi:hypothetical protein
MGKTFRRSSHEYDVEYSRKWSKQSRKNRGKRKVQDLGYSSSNEQYNDDEW